MLRVQIIIKNNQTTIENCLLSLAPLKADLRIIDIGSTDTTPEICRGLGYQVLRGSLNQDYSALRNENLSPTWNMWLDPHEELLTGHDEINMIVKENEKHAFNFSIIQGTVLTKEIRLWNTGLKFTNPVYETIKGTGRDLDWLILSKQSQLDLDHRASLVEAWKKEKPLAKEPYYYQALTALLRRNYQEFQRLADYYLSIDRQEMASLMLRFYLATVQAYELDRLNEAARNILICIAAKPVMAEFWCLLGDIQYRLRNYQKAIAFYENAIHLGSRRLKADPWPMDVSKYKEYPLKMIADSEKIMRETKLYYKLAT